MQPQADVPRKALAVKILTIPCSPVPMVCYSLSSLNLFETYSPKKTTGIQPLLMKSAWIQNHYFLFFYFYYSSLLPHHWRVTSLSPLTLFFTSFPPFFFFLGFSLSLGSVEQQTPSWVPDSDSPVCFMCSDRFSWKRRRHHCRGCGHVSFQ